MAGAEEEKEELYEIVDFLKHPKICQLGRQNSQRRTLGRTPEQARRFLQKPSPAEANVPFFSIWL